MQATAIAAALQKALAVLPAGSALRSALESEPDAAAATLLRELQALAAAAPVRGGEGAAQAAVAGGKRSKRAKQQQQQQEQRGLDQGPAAGRCGEAATAEEATAQMAGGAAATTGGGAAAALSDSVLLDRIAATMASDVLDWRSQLPLLLARSPPDDRLLPWLLSKLKVSQTEAAGGDAAAGLLDSAATAIRLCSGLAGLAVTMDEAMACYDGAVSQLREAGELLLPQSGGGAEADAGVGRATPAAAARQQQQQQSGNHAAEDDSSDDESASAAAAAATAAPLERLALLAGRLFTCMNLELARPRLPSTRLLTCWSGNANASARGAAAATRAAAAAAALVLLRLRLEVRRLQAAGADARRRRVALQARAQYDLRLLRPYGAAGVLAYLGDTPPPELAASCPALLPLHAGLAAQTSFDPAQYFARLLAARGVAAAAEARGELLESAGVLAGAERLPVPPAVVQWLRAQPPSAVVTAALAAVAAGPRRLSSHLLHEAPLDSLRALAVALAAGGLGGGSGAPSSAAAGRGGAEGASGGDVTDQLLFFTDTHGDGSMFGRDWGPAEGYEGEEDGDAEARVGIDLEELDRPLSEGEGEEEEEEE